MSNQGTSAGWLAIGKGILVDLGELQSAEKISGSEETVIKIGFKNGKDIFAGYKPGEKARADADFQALASILQARNLSVAIKATVT
jgi:hypothetical protein